MPKSRDPSRSKPVCPEPPMEHPPGREEVERAIEGVLGRLLPKPRRSPKRRQAASPPVEPAAYLTLVPDTGSERR